MAARRTCIFLCLGLLCISENAWAQDKSAPVKFYGSPAAAFSPANYPAEARRANEEGRVIVEVSVGPDGKPTGCIVTFRRSPSLDARTCELAMTKVQYTAALDAAGKPIAGKISLPVRWSLEEGAVAVDTGPVQIQKNVAQFDLSVDGIATGCRILEPVQIPPQPCPAQMIGRKMAGGATIKGQAVPSRLTVTQIGVIEANQP